MILTPSEVASIAAWSTFWEVCEYIAEAVVFLGCVGEFIAEYTNVQTEHWRHALGRRSLIILTLGIGAGLFSLIKTNALAGQVIGSLGEQAGQAGKKAQLATDVSNTAILRSGQAAVVSGDAASKASKAEGSASNALALARGARREADSFEKDIISAKKQAADAESHLAEALKQAADARAELDRIGTPRSIINASELAVKLGSFKNTEYAFASVFQDSESINLLKDIDALLQHAGWTKVKPPHGFPALNIYGKEDGFAVTVGFNTGIQISVNSLEAGTVQSLPIEKLPPWIAASVALDLGLVSNLSPKPNALDVLKVDVKSGDAKTVWIAVGKKP
jgi:hypothetical protein